MSTAAVPSPNLPKTTEVKWSIAKKFVIITGASDGIGKETAYQLFRNGAQVGLVGRSPDKTSRVADQFQELLSQQKHGGHQDGSVPESFRPDVFIADLSSCGEVKRLAVEIKSRWPKVDVLINNVGGYFEKRLMTQDGFEQTFALNHLSYFILTHHLLPALLEQPEGRIINVASEVHRHTQMPWDDLQSVRSYQGFKAYQQSKLANILFTNALARRLENTRVTANSLHPGFVASKFGHNNAGFSSSIFRMFQFFARSEAKGAETSLHLASDPQLSGVSGRYFSDSKVKKPDTEALNFESQERLWKETEKLVSFWL